jgi:hypothetical protein
MTGDTANELDVEAVIEAFGTVTGEDVRVAGAFAHPDFASDWVRLDLADASARPKFGSFHLVVFEDLEGARRQGSLPEQDRLEARWQELAPRVPPRPPRGAPRSPTATCS